jgi:hypothetical protein
MLIETLLGLLLGVLLIVIAAGLFEVFASDAEERIANSCAAGRRGDDAAA